MTTDVVKKIGNTNSPVTMDYTTFAAWAAAAPASLVTADQRWIGEVYNQGEMSVASQVSLGATCSATQCYVIRAATGASFRDNASAATNPLRYNETVGAAITFNLGHTALFVGNGTNGFIEVADLQFRLLGGYTDGCISSWGGVYIHGCIFSRNDFTNAYPAAIQFDTSSNSYASTVENCLIINEGSGGGLLIGIGHVNVVPVLRNNTHVWINAPTGAGAILAGYGTAVIYNSAFFGFTGGAVPISMSSVSAGGNNITDASSFGTNPPASPGTTSAAFTTANFTALSGVTHGTGTGYDFAIPTGSALKNAGTTGAATDILGTARPQGGSWDIGAYEFVVVSTVNTGWLQPFSQALILRPEMVPY